MSATLLQLPQRPAPQDATLHDLRFRALLGSGSWEALPPEVQRRFSKRLTGAQVALYRGLVVEMRQSRLGWLIGQLCRLFGAPLPLNPAAGGGALVSVSEDRAGGGQCWTRIYARADRFPQVIHSAKRFAGPTGLEEYLGHGIGIALRLTAEHDALLFIGDHYFLRLFGLRLRWPRWLAPGELAIRHQDLGGGRFLFALDLIHPRLGELVHQVALFADPVEP